MGVIVTERSSWALFFENRRSGKQTRLSWDPGPNWGFRNQKRVVLKIFCKNISAQSEHPTTFTWLNWPGMTPHCLRFEIRETSCNFFSWKISSYTVSKISKIVDFKKFSILIISVLMCYTSLGKTRRRARCTHFNNSISFLLASRLQVYTVQLRRLKARKKLQRLGRIPRRFKK